MSNFFDAVCLIKYDRTNGAHILDFYPEDFNFLNQENILSICSFPEIHSETSVNNTATIPITIYATSIEKCICYVLSFIYQSDFSNEKEPYSLVIISHRMIASEIFKILLDARIFLLELLKEEEKKKQFKKVPNSNSNNTVNLPVALYEEIKKCIQSCVFNEKLLVLTLVTPIRTFDVILRNDHVTFSQFDPNFWLSPQTNLYAIWRALMTNRGILIVGQSPSQVACAVFSIISLAAPLKYYEPYIPYTRLGDPRFTEIISEQSLKWKIVGTTNVLLAERCKQFAVIGLLSPLKGKMLLEVDPDILHQKLLMNDKSSKMKSPFKFAKNQSNGPNSNSNFGLKKFDFFRNFNQNLNSLFSFQSNKSSSDSENDSSKMSHVDMLRNTGAIRKATKKMMTLIEFRLNNKIDNDPYFDILEKPLVEEDFYGIFVPPKSSGAKSDASNQKESISNDKNDTKNDTIKSGAKNDIIKNDTKNDTIKNDIIKNDTKNDTIKNDTIKNDTKNDTIKNDIIKSVSKNDTKRDNVKSAKNDSIIENYSETFKSCLQSTHLQSDSLEGFGINCIDAIAETPIEGSIIINDNKTDELDFDAFSDEKSAKSSLAPPNILPGKSKPNPLHMSKPLKLKPFPSLATRLSSKASIAASVYLNNKKLNPKIRFFAIKDALRLQNSSTFSEWRKNITYRPHFREAFLSILPVEALSGRSKEELALILNALVYDVSKRYKKDMHMSAVIKAHIRIAKCKLGINFKIIK